MKDGQPLIIIGGATAVGKTSLSVKLAEAAGGEIISADSMQVYKGMDTGTAKIKKEETQGIPHYMIDEVAPDFDFNVFEFKKRALGYIKKIYENGHIPILVGGTGFYIQAVLYDIDFSDEEGGKEYRNYLEGLDLKELNLMLRQSDPGSALAIHENNRKRIIRALEFYHRNGSAISSHNKEQSAKTSPYNFAYFVLDRPREQIYARIEQRVDMMLEEGLVDEVRGLLDGGLSENAVSMQAIGYRQILKYLKGEASLEETADLIKLDTRHFAKRQITWFKREKDAVWINYADYADESEILAEMTDILKEKNIV